MNRIDEQALLLNLSRLQAIAQSGKAYSKDVFDQERYEELTAVTESLIAQLTPVPETQLAVFMTVDEGYATPKVDIRAAVFNEKNQLLLVKEKREGCWTLPGGWGDVGYSPFEVAKKETLEEAGVNIIPKKLIALRDMAKHDYPYRLTYVYKLFIYCRWQSGQPVSGVETSDARFFDIDEIQSLDLSLSRNSFADLMMAYAYHQAPFPTICD